jgi:hypothetical protein
MEPSWQLQEKCQGLSLWVKGRIRHKNTNFIVFGLTGPGLKPTIDSIKGEQANLYTTDEVKKI